MAEVFPKYVSPPKKFPTSGRYSEMLFDAKSVEDDFLLDNGLTYSVFGSFDSLYTTMPVVTENPQNYIWKRLSSNKHVFSSSSRANFKNGSMAYFTGHEDTVFSDSLVTYNTGIGLLGACPKNCTSLVTLTGVCGTAVACSHCSYLSSAADFSLIVEVVKRPLILVTNDKCLGWSTRHLGSCKQDENTGLLIRWKDIYD